MVYKYGRYVSRKRLYRRRGIDEWLVGPFIDDMVEMQMLRKSKMYMGKHFTIQLRKIFRYRPGRDEWKVFRDVYEMSKMFRY